MTGRDGQRALAILAVLFGLGLGLGQVMSLKTGVLGAREAAAAPEAETPATAPAREGPGRPGSAVYPDQDIPLKFDHSRHLALGMDCAACHADVARSTRAAENNFPVGKRCDACHGEQHPPPPGAPKDCHVCHTQVEDGRVTAGLRAPRPLLHFNHQSHLTRGGQTLSCATCHGDMSKVRVASTLQLPDEADCLKCHNGVQADDRCGLCHPSDARGKLVTRVFNDRGAPRLIPRGRSNWGATHDLAFIEDHKAIAKASPKLCASCHDEDDCTSCHAGVVRPMRIHAADYMTTHALDARAGTQNCQSCHRLQTDCLACHERLGMGVGPDSKFGVGSAQRFHPAGWAGAPGTPQGHAPAAQRNIAACASCHAEDSCLACHATTGAARPGLNASPHGPGFASSASCRALSLHNRRVCLKCHPPTDARIECI